MSAPKVMAQSASGGLYSAPNTRIPTLVHFKALVTDGSGTASMVADIDATSGDAGTTPGVTLTRSAAGTYDIVFDPCRQVYMGTFVCNVMPNVIATGTEGRHVSIDKTDANTSAKLGKIRFNTVALGGSTVTDPVSGSEIHGSFWADFG